MTIKILPLNVPVLISLTLSRNHSRSIAHVLQWW